MTDITELARRVEHIISDMKLKHGDKDTYAPVMKWDEFLALEKAQRRIDSQREYYDGVIADGGKRIAELEYRAVKLPKPITLTPETGFTMTLSSWQKLFAKVQICRQCSR